MSRSRKKYPIVVDNRCKRLKRAANKKVRQYNKQVCRNSSDRHYIGNGKCYMKVFESYDICDYKWMLSYEEYYRNERLYESLSRWYIETLTDKEIYTNWYRAYKMK